MSTRTEAIELLIKKGLVLTPSNLIIFVKGNDVVSVNTLIKCIPADLSCFTEALNIENNSDKYWMIYELLENYDLSESDKGLIYIRILKLYNISKKDTSLSAIIEMITEEFIKPYHKKVEEVKTAYVNPILEVCKECNMDKLKKVVQKEDIDQSDLHEALDYCWSVKFYHSYTIIDEVCHIRCKETPSFVNFCSNNNEDALKIVKFVSPSIKKQGLKACYDKGHIYLFNKLALA